MNARASGEACPADTVAWDRIWQLYLEPRQATVDDLYVIAHLGQSLDGKIAAANGQSCFVTGEDDLVHMHRLRALVDAVVVGAGTVFHDDPQLTVRLCHGPSPVRVVLDPNRRLGTDYRVFRDDGPRTLLLTLPGRRGHGRHGAAEVLEVGSATDGRYCPRKVLGVLAAQGLRRLMVEGGGATVARFWQAGCLDRLDLCIAPVIIGKGREALPLPSVQSMDEAERFQPERLMLGPDLLHVLRRSRQPLDPGKKQQVAMAHPHAGGRGVPLPAP